MLTLLAPVFVILASRSLLPVWASLEQRDAALKKLVELKFELEDKRINLEDMKTDLEMQKEQLEEMQTKLDLFEFPTETQEFESAILTLLDKNPNQRLDWYRALPTPLKRHVLLDEGFGSGICDIVYETSVQVFTEIVEKRAFAVSQLEQALPGLAAEIFAIQEELQLHVFNNRKVLPGEFLAMVRDLEEELNDKTADLRAATNLCKRIESDLKRSAAQETYNMMVKKARESSEHSSVYQRIIHGLGSNPSSAEIRAILDLARNDEIVGHFICQTEISIKNRKLRSNQQYNDAIIRIEKLEIDTSKLKTKLAKFTADQSPPATGPKNRLFNWKTTFGPLMIGMLILALSGGLHLCTSLPSAAINSLLIAGTVVSIGGVSFVAFVLFGSEKILHFDTKK